MPPSRRKSCLSCVQSKRRCDKGLPKCHRCVAKKTDCEYNGRYLGQLQQTTAGNVDENVELVEPFVDQQSSNWELQRSPRLSVPSILSPCTNEGFINFSNIPIGMPSISQYGFPGPAVIQDIVTRPDPDNPDRIISDATVQARVEFAAKRLALVPKTFSEQGQTMFIHRLLFQERSSLALQDALSACALYCLKNTENQALVFRNLEQRRERLITTTDMLLASKVDLLEALQALILYQIIRLFDGDIRLRAQAEADEPVVLMWAAHLRLLTHQVRRSPPGLEKAGLLPESTSTEWRDWIIEESSRRTVIIAFMLKGIYDFLKLGYDTVPDLRMSFTAQTALWNSQSEFGWRKSQSEREPLEAWVSYWDEAIAKAKPGDLEELGVLIMAMLQGIEATREWLGHSYSVRHGLAEAEYRSV
ncbi:hypothetical protein BBP40_005409 [Aspergillus hancockii]|nr:hypothetical protein BBP40_005409 [Aspergillus hancockii]